MSVCLGTLPGENGVSPEDKQAYIENYGAHRVGISIEECIQYYDEHVGSYEQNLSPGRYNGPDYAANTVARLLCDKNSRILDAAAGTGFLGSQLKEHGFHHVDALEPSRPMLEKARDKGVYDNLICDKLADQQTNIPDDEYDCLVVSGGMGEGHIPCVGLLEMVRTVKPGGYVVIVMREEYLTYVKEYIDRLEPFMSYLTEQGSWKLEERNVVPRYSFGKNGIIFVFTVLESGAPQKPTNFT